MSTSGTTRNGLLVRRIRFGRADDLIIVEVATREALLESGLAGEYMFDQLGDRGSRNGCTDNGDRFVLKRCIRGRYRLDLILLNDAELPFGQRRADPYETDISVILQRLTAPGGAAERGPQSCG